MIAESAIFWTTEASLRPAALMSSRPSHRLGDGNVVSFLHCMNDPQQPEGHMASHIERRKFLAMLGGAAATWPLVALAQQPKVPTIGALVIGNISPEQFWREFRQGLRDLGYVEGQNIRTGELIRAVKIHPFGYLQYPRPLHHQRRLIGVAAIF